MINSEQNLPVGHNCYTNPKWDRNICNMRRREIGEHRWYTDEKMWYKGVSSFVEDIVTITKEDKYLNDWKRKFTASLENKEDSFNQWIDGLADFGTITHEAFNEMLIGKMTTSWLYTEILAFQDRYNLSSLAFNSVFNKTVKNVVSLNQFLNEYQVEVYACEQMFKSERLKTATPCDIVGRGLFQTKKGGKSVDSYVFANIKTSEASGRFPHHKWQCLIELICGLETVLPNLEKGIPICSGVVRTTDFRGEPTTDFKPYWFVSFDKNDFPIITSYEGESADVFVKIINSIFHVKDVSGGFEIPKISTYFWEGNIEYDNLVKKDFFTFINDKDENK